MYITKPLIELKFSFIFIFKIEYFSFGNGYYMTFNETNSTNTLETIQLNHLFRNCTQSLTAVQSSLLSFHKSLY